MSDKDTLDSLITEPPETKPLDFNDHLSYPSFLNEQKPERTGEPEHQPRQLLKDRLYIGNLHPTVDEFSLLQVFSKFGKVTKLDFLFHKTGLLKGKPRGYAFVEYGNQNDAQKALTMAHDKLLRGRKLVVTFAHQAPLDQYGNGLATPYGASGTKYRKTMMETGRPTTLSMLKTGFGGRHDGTQNKIAMMEAKLRQMESTNPKPRVSSPPVASSSGLSTVNSTPTSRISSGHPSLPNKPPPSLLITPDTQQHVSVSSVRMGSRPLTKQIPPLPSLPILPQSHTWPSENRASSSSLNSAARQPRQTQGTKFKFAGVKIKPKEKDKEKSQTLTDRPVVE